MAKRGKGGGFVAEGKLMGDEKNKKEEKKKEKGKKGKRRENGKKKFTNFASNSVKCENNFIFSLSFHEIFPLIVEEDIVKEILKNNEKIRRRRG